MNLINKKILAQRIINYEFPSGEKYDKIATLIRNWQKALKDSDLEKTKEKSIQGKFLITFFESILGYTDVTSGLTEWSLIQHPKIENDSMEPDGSLGWYTKDQKLTKVVIELKDAHTLLDKKQTSRAGKLTPIEQAYLYSTKYNGCNWIIVSNFKEIRLYNKNKTQDFYEKFEVLDLLKETEFRRFYYLLGIENLISKDSESTVDILSKDTSFIEKDITNKFYVEYKKARLDLFNHLLANNSYTQKKILLEQTQKLLDRLVFILFCEDTSNLLPLNIVKNTFDRAISSLSPSDERVWTEFKGLFLAIDKGNARVKPPINAYNGGLFAYDEALDNLHIKDDFWTNLMHLANYDFETDLNVNILGHIFEQSISDLEAIKQEIENDEVGKSTSRRKKDGIYYTPEYITRYIVENTLGRYLEQHPEKLESIKVLDPACGSGAFLNQAHSFLRNQWNIAYEEGRVKSKDAELGALFNYNPVETDRSILLNNLHGVDLNQESVEITKLALWLKTARSSEPLQNLDRNIKCGNSLISDQGVALDKAFDWNKEFNNIMTGGGFDIIIGNPPYVRNELINTEDKTYYETYFPNTHTGKSDLYVYFFEQFFNLLSDEGIAGMIVSSKYTKTKYGKKLISFLQDNCVIHEFIDFKDSDVFEGITAYPSIIIFSKGKDTNKTKLVNIPRDLPVPDISTIVQKNSILIPQAEIFDSIGSWNHNNSPEVSGIYKKLDTKFKKFNEIGLKPQVGIKTGLNKAYFIRDKDVDKNDPQVKKYIVGQDVKRYATIEPDLWIVFPYKEVDKQLILVPEEELSPYVRSHLLPFKDDLENRAIIKEGLKNGTKKWYEYQQINIGFNLSEYIIYPDISNGVNFTIAKENPFDMTCFGIQSKSKVLLAILNSKLIEMYLENITVKARGGYLRLKSQYINTIPMPASFENSVIEDCVDELTQFSELLNSEYSISISLLKNEVSNDFKLSLNDFVNFGINQFLDRLANYETNILQKEDLMRWFKQKQMDMRKLQDNIRSLNSRINTEVYNLYGLSSDEVQILESKM